MIKTTVSNSGKACTIRRTLMTPWFKKKISEKKYVFVEKDLMYYFIMAMWIPVCLTVPKGKVRKIGYWQALKSNKGVNIKALEDIHKSYDRITLALKK